VCVDASQFDIATHATVDFQEGREKVERLRVRGVEEVGNEEEGVCWAVDVIYLRERERERAGEREWRGNGCSNGLR